VLNGAECDCHCLCCGEKLTAKNGGAIVAHHFAHKPGSSCSGGTGESLFHWAFKMSIVKTGLLPTSRGYSINELEALRINLDCANPRLIRLSSPKPEVEIKCGGSLYICDVEAFSGDKRLGIEVTYTHETSETKIKDLTRYGVSVIELTLHKSLLPELSLLIELINDNEWLKLLKVFTDVCSIKMPESWNEQIMLYQKSTLVDELRFDIEASRVQNRHLLNRERDLKEEVQRLQGVESACFSKVDELETRLSSLMAIDPKNKMNNAFISRVLELEDKLAITNCN